MEVTGTAVTYNREATMPAATFYDVGDTWTEATPTFTQVTTALRIMGGDADVDNFLQATYADPLVQMSRGFAVAMAGVPRRSPQRRLCVAGCSISLSDPNRDAKPPHHD